MRILLIRHAEAEASTSFEGSDLERPLTERGKKRFARVMEYLTAGYPAPDRLICSCAVRAHETARMAARAWGHLPIETREELNPGATWTDLKRVLGESPDAEWVVLVGHEPDFSRAISSWVAQGKLRVKLKKGGVAEVEWPGRGAGVLRALLDPARL